jgi:hypothetical protein
MPTIDLKELQELSTEALLERAHKAQLVDLVAKLEAGVLSHQEHAVLARLLKDNGMNLLEGLRPKTIEGKAQEVLPPTSQVEGGQEAPRPLALPVFNDEEDNNYE